MILQRDSVAGLTVSASVGVLAQCASFIGGVPEEAYGRPASAVGGSTIGQHVRHSLDHFRAVLAGLDGGVIDYDRRERDTPAERSPGAAAEEIGALLGRLRSVRDADLLFPVRVRVVLTAEGGEAELGSTLGRELAFAAHHAVHHHALMGAIAGELGLPTPPGFGKAPSTVLHGRRAGAAAG